MCQVVASHPSTLQLRQELTALTTKRVRWSSSWRSVDGKRERVRDSNQEQPPRHSRQGMGLGRAVASHGGRNNGGSSGSVISSVFRRRNGLVRSSPGATAGALTIAAKPSAWRQLSTVKPPTLAGGRLLLPKEAPFASPAVGQQQQAEEEQEEYGDVVLLAQESFRKEMTKERRPLQFLGIDTATTIGSVCGHTSLGILALGYLETDALSLRELVVAGSSLNLFFSYYRTPPLWISIKWNLFFLAINAALIGAMWKEKEDAEEFGKDPEQARIYQDIFMPVDLNPVEFMQLMGQAQRRVVLEGNDINQQGRPHEEMFLIVEGTADVRSEGEDVCRLEPGGFVGSMAFNAFIQESPVASSHTAARGTADASPAGGGAGDCKDQADSVFIEGLVVGDGGYKYGGKGVLDLVKGVIFNMLRGDSVVGNVALSLVPDVVDGPKDLRKMECTMNTVTATSDVVVYVWDQHALRAFIKRRPLIGAGLQKAISEDFSNKVNQSRGHKTKYRMLLEQTLEGGKINQTEKRKLQRYRETHGIALEEHKFMLAERGWTEEDFEVGFQPGVAPRQGSQHFVKYEALVQRELAKGEVKPDSKLYLLNFRKHAGIDAQEHILALEKQGWTVDDYEVGVKGMSSAFNQDLNGSFDGSDDVQQEINSRDNDKSSSNADKAETIQINNNDDDDNNTDNADTIKLNSAVEDVCRENREMIKEEGERGSGLNRTLHVTTRPTDSSRGREMAHKYGA